MFTGARREKILSEFVAKMLCTLVPCEIRKHSLITIFFADVSENFRNFETTQRQRPAGPVRTTIQHNKLGLLQQQWNVSNYLYIVPQKRSCTDPVFLTIILVPEPRSGPDQPNYFSLTTLHGKKQLVQIIIIINSKNTQWAVQRSDKRIIISVIEQVIQRQYQTRMQNGTMPIAMKKKQRRRKHCALAVVRRSQKFSPAADPLPGGAGRPKFNKLEMVTTFTYKASFGEHAISSYRGNRPSRIHTNIHTHRPTNRQDRLQYTAPQLAHSVKNVLYCACIYWVSQNRKTSLPTACAPNKSTTPPTRQCPSSRWRNVNARRLT